MRDLDPGRSNQLPESRGLSFAYLVVDQASRPPGYNVQEFRIASDLVLETSDDNDRQTFGLKTITRFGAFVNLWLQRVNFLSGYVCVIGIESFVPNPELAHDSVSSDTIEPPIMPFSPLDLLQLLSLLLRALLSPYLVFNLFLLVCVDTAETSPGDIQYLSELVG